MTEHINKSYVQRYIKQAGNTDNPKIENDCLYRAGTHMEVIDCNGNADLTPEQKQTVLDAAAELLGGDNA